MNIDKLLELGREWKKDNYHRIYFNNIDELAGLSVSKYNTGNVSSASLNGESISNSQARKMMSNSFTKLWYDVNDGKFCGTNIDDNIFDLATEKIKSIAE